MHLGFIADSLPFDWTGIQEYVEVFGKVDGEKIKNWYVIFIPDSDVTTFSLMVRNVKLVPENQLDNSQQRLYRLIQNGIAERNTPKHGTLDSILP